jgi:KaiC/GvpD/RAD55 family RecA-like ATPase
VSVTTAAAAGHPRLACHAARIAILAGLLALGLPVTSSAQALGTMQVTAHVLPASAAWAGITLTAAAARSAIRSQSGLPHTSRDGLVHARSEIVESGGRRRLLVSIQYPHN